MPLGDVSFLATRPGPWMIEGGRSRGRRRRKGALLIQVALAVRPQADLVEVMQAQRAGDGVDEDEVGGAEGLGEDAGEVEAEEIGVPDDGQRIDVADNCLLRNQIIIPPSPFLFPLLWDLCKDRFWGRDARGSGR